MLCLLLRQKVLAAHGATKVSAYVTHAVFPNRSWGRFIHKNCGNHLANVFKPSHLIYLFMSNSDFPSTAMLENSEKAFAYFWITDSCPRTVKAIANEAPFEVLSLAGSIADALQI